jgi:hypothetical protein
VTSPVNSGAMSMISVKKAFDKGQYKVSCPCSKCENKSDQTQLTMDHIWVCGKLYPVDLPW